MNFPLRADAYTEPGNYRLDLQVWDKDLLTKNDFIASQTMDAWPAVRGCVINGSKWKLTDKEGNDRLEVKARGRPGGPFEGKECKIVLSIECLTKAE